MGKGGKKKHRPISPLHKGGPAVVGLWGRGLEVVLVKVPVIVEFDPARPSESLVAATNAALASAVSDDDPN